MMKNVIVLFMLFLPLPAFCPPDPGAWIVSSAPYYPYERLWEAVCQVESSGDRHAYNDDEEATGIAQIRPIRVTDYNQRTGKARELEDCYEVAVSKEIFMYYAVRIKDYETIARRWNGSGKKTDIYWEKVKKELSLNNEKQ